MTRFEEIPDDIMFLIAKEVTLEDIYALSHSHPGLRWLTSTHAPFSEEVNLAEGQVIEWAVALRRFVSKRHHLSTGKPAAVYILGDAVDFAFNQGVLITLSPSSLHCISIQDPQMINQSYCIDGALRAVDPHGEAIFSIAHYADGFVFLLQKAGVSPDRTAALIAINLKTLEHRITRVTGWGTREPVITNDAQHAFLCWYSRPTLRDSFGTWIIRPTALPGVRDHKRASSPDVELPNFASEEVGTAVTFRIHNGWFYALSNGELMDPRGIDMEYSSPHPACYRLCRFPVDDPDGNLQYFEKVFRRDPSKGPLHNAWVELDLHVDEATDNLVIVEARREWLNLASKPSRACYLTHVSVGAKEAAQISDEWQEHGFDRDLKPSLSIHPERGIHGDTTIPLPSTNKIKFRGYNPSVGAFIELVADENECLQAGQPTFVLRSSSRSAGALPDGVREENVIGGVRYTPVHRWPGCPLGGSQIESDSADAAKEIALQRLMKSNIKASMDGSCLVYMEQKDARRRNPSASVHGRDEPMSPVIVVSFDEGVDFSDSARNGVTWGHRYEPTSHLEALLEQRSRTSASPA